jgi:phosphatidylserine synthase
MHSYSSSQYFIGLPIPAAAICLALMVMLKPEIPDNIMLRMLVLATVYGLAWLMVSKCRFRSFKDIDWKRRRPVGTLVITMILVGAVLHAPVLILSILMFSYVASGLMMRLSPQWMRHHFERLDTWFSGVKVLDDPETTELESDVPNEEQPEDQDPVTSSD